MSTKKCPNCQLECDENARFCRNCGTPFASATPVTPVIPPASATPVTPPIPVAPAASATPDTPVLGVDMHAHPIQDTGGTPISQQEAQVEPQVQVIPPAPAPATAPESDSKGKSSGFFKIAFFILLGVALILGLLLFNSCRRNEESQGQSSHLRGEVSSLNREVDELQSQLEEARDEANELRTLKDKIMQYMPLLVTDLKVSNVEYDGTVETGPNGTIRSANTMYLKPTIEYYGIKPGNYTFYIKLYTPSGTLATGTSSPSGFSYSNPEDVLAGAGHTIDFKGWGSSTRGHWPSGSYRFEIWYGDMCLKSKNFTVY